MMSRALIIGGVALGGLVLLESAAVRTLVGSAGAANRAATEYIRTHPIDGITFAVSDRANMEETHAAMTAALGGASDSDYEGLDSVKRLRDICDLWLQAQQQACTGSPTPPRIGPVGLADMLADPDFNADAYRDYSLIPAQADDDDGILPHSTASCQPGTACSEGPLTRMGRAVCTLRALRDKSWGLELVEVLAATRELARAMDAADFRLTGERRSEKEGELGTLADVPGRVVGKVVDVVAAAAQQPLILLAVAGVIAWRVLR